MTTRYARNPVVEAAPMQSEAVLFNPDTRRFCLLNATAAFLWERLVEPMTIEQLAADVCRQFAGVEASRAAQDVRQAVAQFAELSFVVSVS